MTSDHVDAGVEERHVVVRDQSPALLDEHIAVTQIGGSLPDARDDFRRLLKGIHLIRDSEVLVSDHVKENSIERLVTGRRQMGREILGADEDVDFRGTELAVVLTIRKEEIDAHFGLGLFEDVREGNEHSDARSSVVRPRDRHLPLRLCCGGFRNGPRVPVGKVENPLTQLRSKAREDVPERELFPVGGCVGEALDDDGIRSRAHLANYPVARRFCRWRSGNARTEIDLCLRVSIRRGAIEPGRRFCGLALARGAALLGVTTTRDGERHEHGNPH